MDKTYEVVVIGGGPSGSACATFLKQRGHSVLLLEKEPTTKFKVGESLLPALWEFWNKLGVTERIETDGFPIKRGIVFKISEDEYLLRTDEYPEYFFRPYTYHVDRAKYDRILLDNAAEKGVDLEEGATVSEVLFEGDRAVGVVYQTAAGEQHTVRCQVVVDATGRATMLASKLKRRYAHPSLRKVSFFTHFDGAKRRLNALDGSPGGDEYSNDGSTVTDIHSTEGGWIWVIPLRGNLTSVGLVLDGAWVKEHPGTPEEIFKAGIAADPEVAGWLEGATQTMELQRIPSISYLCDDFVGDGFVMIGDAALFIDPIFSAGVTIAMRAADFAAEIISDALKTGDTSAASLKRYEDKIRPPIEKITKMIINWYQIMARKDRANIFAWSRTMPGLRERLIVLLSGGYDRIDLDSIATWS